ncbi:unnamed protein product [Calypogeia fissa]
MAAPRWWRVFSFGVLCWCVWLISWRRRGPSACCVYREIGVALHASPSQLGSLTLLRSITEALFSVAGFLAQQYNRASIIAAACCMDLP